MGCHFLLQCMKVKSESEVAQSYPTLSDPRDCSVPGSSIHGIFQTRILEWVPLPSLAEVSAASLTSVIKNVPVWQETGFDPWVGAIPWGRARQPTPVFLPKEPHGQRSLAGYNPRAAESDMTERLKYTQCKTNNAVFMFCLFHKSRFPLLISFC